MKITLKTTSYYQGNKKISKKLGIALLICGVIILSIIIVSLYSLASNLHNSFSDSASSKAEEKKYDAECNDFCTSFPQAEKYSIEQIGFSKYYTCKCFTSAEYEIESKTFSS